MCAILALVVATWVGVAVKGQDRGWIQQVCDRVRTVDSSLLKDIDNLATIDPDDFLNNMREYVQAIKSFQTCIGEDKDIVVDMAQDILEEEGPKFYYHYDPEHIQNVTNWGESEMDECNQLHKQAVEVWEDIDKVLSVNKGNGREQSGNQFEDKQPSANRSPEIQNAAEKTEEKWVEHNFLDN